MLYCPSFPHFIPTPPIPKRNRKRANFSGPDIAHNWDRLGAREKIKKVRVTCAEMESTGNAGLHSVANEMCSRVREKGFSASQGVKLPARQMVINSTYLSSMSKIRIYVMFYVYWTGLYV